MTRQTLQDDILDTLGRRITSAEYESLRVLRTEDLEAEFRVSRTVAREALKVLESMGLVGMRRSVGVIVQEPSNWNVFDPRVIRWKLSGPLRSAQLSSLTQLRVAVEPVAARYAAVRANAEERHEMLQLSRLLHEAGDSGDLKAFLSHDIAYHCLLLRASRNEMFTALSDVVAEVLTGRTVHHLMPTRPKPEALRLHYLTAQAIADGRAQTAEHAMRGVLSEVNEQMEILARLEQGIQDRR